MLKQVAKWKSSARVKVDPQVALQALDAIREKKGEDGLTPADVVKAARSKSHPLHSEFVWDDAIAAEQHRLLRAGYLIRSLEVTVTRSGRKKAEATTVTVRQYTSVGGGAGAGKDSRYVNTSEAMSDEDMRLEVLHKVWNQLLALRRQYNDLAEFATIWSAMDELPNTIAG